MAHAHPRAFVTFALSLLAACGAATAADPGPVFASIQVDEARIEHAALAIERSDDAAERRAQGEEVCAASEHLCSAAGGLDDRDASERCRRASERCVRARAETSGGESTTP